MIRSIFVFFLLFPLSLVSQDSLGKISKKYVFLRLAENRIGNDSSLYPFFETLSDTTRVIPIVHLGDSHIQADHFSGRIRLGLQMKFGNAGRGLVYPYRVARTNEPLSYRTWSNVQWKSKRNVFPDQPLPIGVSGITIEASDTSANINLTVKDQDGLDYRFKKFVLFHEKGPSAYNYAVCDEFNCRIGYINSRDTSSRFTSSVQFISPVRHVVLQCAAEDTFSSCARIYGMMLTNESPGILYHTIGVNGAEFRHYNQSSLFLGQIKFLDPKLVIVSLGTNDAYPYSFRREEFRAQMDTLITSLKKVLPETTFILTTPGDSYRRTRKGRVRNPNMKIAGEVIIDYCKNNNLAYWDLFSVMGGYGSMAKWYAAGLAARDRLHFSGRGYDLQGFLLNSALMESFEKYKASSTKP